MASPIDFLVDMLCQQGTASSCQSFISSYPDPASQIVFFLFFPVVFLIIFVYILGSGIAGSVNNPKLSVLISVAIFAFIVFQGWYHIFLNISKFWFFAVIILGGFYVVVNRMGPASGGGGGNTTRHLAGLVDFAKGGVKRKLAGKEKAKKTQIEQTMKNLESLVHTMEGELRNPSPGTNMADMFREYENIKRTLLTYIDEYDEMGKTNVGGIEWNILKKAERYQEELKKLDEKVEKIAKKYAKG